MTDLDGRVAFITGSSRGIGLATADVFATRGATVILNGSSNRRALDERVEELSSRHGRTAWGIICDASRPVEIRAAYQQIFREHGRLDILVNNAGILEDALIGMVSDELVARTFETNTYGAIHHLQAAARLMKRKRRGSIVNLTSIVGVNGNVGQIVYSSSKAALIGLTKSAAKELAPHGVRVNAVAPGFIDTDMTRAIPADKYSERLASVAMGRIGSAEDVARAIAFLASDEAAYITGQVLGVDGGMLV
jgi:3-oxoacyl-[acyl-carrier protein] reductase